MPSIKETIAYIKSLYGDRLDKAGMPGWWHPLQVLVRLSSGARPAEQQAALLCDLYEDRLISLAELAERGYDQQTLAILEVFSAAKQGSMSYQGYVARIMASQNFSAVRIKYAALVDRAAPSWQARLPEEYASRGKKYEEARQETDRAFAQALKEDAKEMMRLPTDELGPKAMELEARKIMLDTGLGCIPRGDLTSGGKAALKCFMAAKEWSAWIAAHGLARKRKAVAPDSPADHGTTDPEHP